MIWATGANWQTHEKQTRCGSEDYGLPLGFLNHIDIHFKIMQLEHFLQYVIVQFGTQFLEDVEATSFSLFLLIVDYASRWALCFYLLYSGCYAQVRGAIFSKCVVEIVVRPHLVDSKTSWLCRLKAKEMKHPLRSLKMEQAKACV